MGVAKGKTLGCFVACVTNVVSTFGSIQHLGVIRVHVELPLITIQF